MAPPESKASDQKVEPGKFCPLLTVRVRVRLPSGNTRRFDLEAWFRRSLTPDGLPEQIDLVYQCMDTCTYYFLCCDLDPKKEVCNAITMDALLQRLLKRDLGHRKNRSCDCSLATYCRGVVPEPTPSKTHPPVKIDTARLQQFLLSPEPKCPPKPAKSDGASKYTKPSEAPGPATPAKSDEQSLLLVQHTKLADGAHDIEAGADAPPKYTKLPERTHNTKAMSNKGNWFVILIHKGFRAKD